MMKNYHTLPTLFFRVVIFASMSYLQCAGDVTDITGDTGTAQSGSLAISGGTSGASFDSSTTTITQSINFISMPLTTSTNGQIICSGETILHNYGEDLQNIFVGDTAGNFSLTGGDNTACGGFALNVLTAGAENTAVGQSSLISLTEGNDNVAVGFSAGSGVVDGISNTLIGQGAGSAYTSSESNNIILGNSPGLVGESNTTRISNGGAQVACFIDGIYGASVDFSTALPAYVDDAGTLGTMVSSARFKNNMRPIGHESSAILRLRPISYTLKSDRNNTKQFGLCAEEVNHVFPDLVIKDKKGEPFSVRYFELPVLLLNELQKAVERIEHLEHRIKKLEEKLSK